MLLGELKKIIKESNLPDNAEIKIQDGVGDTFKTICANYKENGSILTILVSDIIF